MSYGITKFADLKENYDLAVLDIQMPRYDGIDLKNDLLCYSPKTRIVLISGLKNYDVDLSNQTEGVYRCITKETLVKEPFDFIMLVNKILEQEPKGEPRVFIAHGHDEAAKLLVARFIEEMGMTPVILTEQANIGRTVIEKFEQNTDVCFAVVILTPDDTASLRGGDAKPCLLARQNVILELGYFFAKLGRKKVCALHKAQVEIPSNIHGVLYIPMDEGEGWKIRLAKEMKKAGIPVELSL